MTTNFMTDPTRKGVRKKKHSTDVKPPSPPRVYVRIHPKGKSSSDVASSACSH